MSLGKDLSIIRKGLGLSLEEIQSSIKIPLLTLKSIENDSIFSSTEHNKTYIRNFIRSYARALKLDEQKVVDALDAYEAGIYDGELLSREDVRVTPSVEEKEEEPKEEVAPVIQKEEAKEAKKPTVENVNWADMGKKFSSEEASSKTRVIILVAFFVLALLATAIFFRNEIIGFFGSNEPETSEVAPIPEAPEPEAEAEAIDTTRNSTTQNTIDPILPPTSTLQTETPQFISTPPSEVNTVAVYAAFDKLEPVRVTSDLNWRTNPFWMEQGEAFYFDFNDTLLVRGQYSRMLILYNGHVIENARQLYFDSEYNSLLITKEALENPIYQSSPPAQFPYAEGAPDSIIYRINF
ncbi:MAG: hypothetical protein ED557_12440 [Balneola sp.]|nr:MAG: hypothetical protein ED557_12440 [Balneola sp.]